MKAALILGTQLFAAHPAYAEDDIDVGKTQISIKDKNRFAHFCKRYRSVGDNSCLSDAAFAACYGEYTGYTVIVRFDYPVRLFVKRTQGFCLVRR